MNKIKFNGLTTKEALIQLYNSLNKNNLSHYKKEVIISYFLSIYNFYIVIKRYFRFFRNK